MVVDDKTNYFLKYDHDNLQAREQPGGDGESA
jgi:hypothetical protein